MCAERSLLCPQPPPHTHPLPPRRAFGKRLEAGKAAKTIMVRANYRLVLNIVSKYRGRGMEMHDLIAEGMHGLLRGVEKFDADKGFRFSTYAHWWIRQSVTRAISTQSRAVRWARRVWMCVVCVRTCVRVCACVCVVCVRACM